MNTEDIEFNDWVYDRQVEQSYFPIKIGKTAKTIFFFCFWMLVAIGILKQVRPFSFPNWIIFTGLGGLVVGLILAFVFKSRSQTAPICAVCGKPMVLITTIPTKRECEEKNYIRGASGHAYMESVDGEGGVGEIRKQWYGCSPCKRYFLLNGGVLELIYSIEEREEEYATNAKILRSLAGKRFRLKNKTKTAT